MQASLGPLGRPTPYPEHYDPALLLPIARAGNRATLAPLPAWFGADLWNAYEVSWLNTRGKPVVAMAQFEFPHDSPNLIESKSLKLYLNAFTETRFAGEDAVLDRMSHDLSAAAGAAVGVRLNQGSLRAPLGLRPPEGASIDDLDIAIEHYEPAAGLLRCTPGTANETLTSNLLKSNCPVTGQPDWASVQIRYQGPAIDHASLLAYIVSLRRSREFHEHCVERMYCDIWHTCHPRALMVRAFYTRRGGLDINPWRASAPQAPAFARTPRQ